MLLKVARQFSSTLALHSDGGAVTVTDAALAAHVEQHMGCMRRAGFRHVQHVRPNRGPHTLGAPTYGQNIVVVLSIFSIVVRYSNYFMLVIIATENRMQVI